MENVDRVVALIERERLDIYARMRKLIDRGEFDSTEFVDLEGEMVKLNAAWDILT
jgi:hypothetical protein